MDNIISQQIDELVAELNRSGQSMNDPVSKLMVTALCHQAQKIRDEIERIPDKVVDRLCSYFVPHDKLNAMPAMSLVQPKLKLRRDMTPHALNAATYFTFKCSPKLQLQYYPLYVNTLIPYKQLHLVSPTLLKSDGRTSTIMFGKKGQVWLGLEMDAEVETMDNVSFYISGTGGVLPQRVYVGKGTVELAFTSATKMEDIPMAEPFDSQQSMDSFFGILTHWKNLLSSDEQGHLLYITDTLIDRDAFKNKGYPKSFQQSFEVRELERFDDSILWILFDFGPDFDVPDNIDIQPNVMPVVNVNINTVTLTQSTPIVKLTKDDQTMFLKVLETTIAARRQGFDTIGEDIIIRDFDASAYNSERLYSDVRNLYNRFVEDHYTFIEYHGLKDTELIKNLRETVNRIGKSVSQVESQSARFDSGTYVMRNVNVPNQTSSIKVAYLTTNGSVGNAPKLGMTMENKRDAAIEKDVPIIVGACGGEDKANADQRYELLRYYMMTVDRLYTRMDVYAFLRMQLLKEYGKTEIKRINYNVTVQGVGAETKVVRGLYIDISFRDEKNYQKALAHGLDRKIRQMIIDRSCISMPIIVSIKSEERWS